MFAKTRPQLDYGISYSSSEVDGAYVRSCCIEEHSADGCDNFCLTLARSVHEKHDGLHDTKLDLSGASGEQHVNKPSKRGLGTLVKDWRALSTVAVCDRS